MDKARQPSESELQLLCLHVEPNSVLHNTQRVTHQSVTITPRNSTLTLQQQPTFTPLHTNILSTNHDCVLGFGAMCFTNRRPVIFGSRYMQTVQKHRLFALKVFEVKVGGHEWFCIGFVMSMWCGDMGNGKVCWF